MVCVKVRCVRRSGSLCEHTADNAFDRTRRGTVQSCVVICAVHRRPEEIAAARIAKSDDVLSGQSIRSLMDKAPCVDVARGIRVRVPAGVKYVRRECKHVRETQSAAATGRRRSVEKGS